SWTYVYDGIATHTDRLGNVTSNAYDAEGRLAAVTDARGYTTTYTYDILGRRTAVIDAIGNTTTQTFDPAGRITSVTDAAGLAQTNTYDSFGRLAATVRRGGFTNEYAYDALNRRIETRLNGQTVAAAGYDAAGRTAWTRNADGLVVSNVYDAAGRLWKTVMPDGTFAENVYSNAFLWKTLDRAGRATATDRDVAGRPVRVTDAAGGVVQYRYDSMGNLTNLVDQAGTVTAWTYDAEGRQIRKTYADGTHYVYTYDALGRLASRTDAKGDTTTYAYDSNGNLTNILHPDASTVIFAYDSLNRKTSMSDSIGTTTWRYDEWGRLTGESGPFGTPEVQLAYDAGGRMTNVIWGTHGTGYEYDALGRITNVVASEGEYGFAYYSNGIHRAAVTYPNGVTETRAHDGLVRCTNLLFSSGTNEWLSISYAYDDADQRTNEVWSTGRAMSYGYDAIGQLTQVDAARPSDAARYAYDATGNPIRRAELGFEVTNAFNNLNQILSGTWTGSTITAVGSVNYPGGTVSVGGASGTIYPDKTFDAAGVPVALGANTLTNVFSDPYGRSVTNNSFVTITNRAYAHDLNGNLTSDGVFTYQYDSANQLTNVIRLADNTRVLSCRYDALGRRVEAIRSDGTTDRYVYFPGSFLVLAVLDETNASKEFYTRGPDLSGSLSNAGGIGGILACSYFSGSVLYHHADIMGNIIILTDASGVLVSTFRYTPFGNVSACLGAVYPRHFFSSKEKDLGASLTYYGLRYYSDFLGKWVTRDIIEEDKQLNRYKYCNNNPLKYGDFWGLESKKITAVWSEDQPTPVGGIVDVPYKYEIELFYEAKCLPTGIAEIIYNGMEGNLLGSDSIGFSFLAIGVTTSWFVELGSRGASFQAIPCPNDPYREEGRLVVHWQVKQKTTVGLNPGFLMFSYDLGASLKWGEWVKQEGTEEIIINCCCEEKK
ncbi:MAG: hypothetical protein J6Y19_02725, partial [Kiritimatiellae bacterium]|nr:hypothetical protein [Kiritimatiellia bacterium]